MNKVAVFEIRKAVFTGNKEIFSDNTKKDVGLSLIKVAGLVLGFGIQLVLTKVIGVKEYGIYVLFTTWTSLLSVLLIFGYDRLILKELSFHYIQKNKQAFRSILDKLLVYVLINSGIFLLLAFLVPQKVLADVFFSSTFLRSTWLLIAFGSVLSTIFGLLGKVLFATQRASLSSIRTEVFFKGILLASVMLLYLFFGKTVGVNIIIVGVIVAYIATLLILTIMDRRRIIDYLSIKKEEIIIGKENFTFFFITLNYLIITQADKIILGKFASLETLGVYGLVSTLIAIISFSSIVYNRFLPKISNYIRSENFVELEKDFKITTRNSLILALPFMMFLLVFTDDILLFFGEKFRAGTPILRILIWGQMIAFFTGPNGNLLINGKYAQIDLINSSVIVVLTIVLNLLGYKNYGVIGVAAASSFGFMLINIAKVVEVKIFYNLFPYEFKNILLAVIVFLSFLFVKVINFNTNTLILKLIINFSLSLLISLLAIASLFLLNKKYERS